MSGEGRRRSKEGGNGAVDLRSRDIWAADFGMVPRGTSGQTGTCGVLIAENETFLARMTMAS